MVSKLRTTPAKDESVSDGLSRLLAGLVKRIPSSIRRAVTPERSDTASGLHTKWQRGVTEAALDLYERKADKDYVDRRREALSYEKLFPQPVSELQIVVPDSTGLKVMSSVVVSSLAGSDEAISHHLVPDETASDARCVIYFNETVSGRVRLQLG
jgi:hypothetical protein